MTKDTTQKNTDFLADLGLNTLPETERNELYVEIGEVVFRSAMRRVWKVLDIKQQDVLTLLLEQSANEPENNQKRVAIDNFLKEHVPHFSEYVAEEIKALKRAQQAAFAVTE